MHRLPFVLVHVLPLFCRRLRFPVSHPGISSFSGRPQDVDGYLEPLFRHARDHIPPSQLASTPVYILATAGMRLLAESDSRAILRQACKYVQSSTPFRIKDCESNVRIISGEEEGVYGWVAINYLMDGFDSHGIADKGQEKHSSTYGFLDMGGASTQIAFEPSTLARKEHADNLLDVNLRLLDGADVHHPVFVTTWLGYGTNQARERYVDALLHSHKLQHPEEQAEHSASTSATELPMRIVRDPCLPSNLMLNEVRYPGTALQGTGDFAQCMTLTSPLLNREVPCPDEPCIMGVHVPPIDFSVNHFIGVSEYWYSTQELWSLGGVYDFQTFQKSALEYCSQDWSAIENSHTIGGSKPVDVHRLEMQCFKAAWIVNVLHEGIGIPRLALDRIPVSGTNETEEALRKAGEKGFAGVPPNFQSVNEINDVAVSWTLGRIVLEVTDSIPRSRIPSQAHSHGEAVDTPAFEWKHGYASNTWANTLSRSMQYVYYPLNPVTLCVLAILVGILYRCACRTAWSGKRSSARPPGEAYGLLSMEEGMQEHGDGASDGMSSPVKHSNAVMRSLTPLRLLASRALHIVGRQGPNQTSYLPLTQHTTSATALPTRPISSSVLSGSPSAVRPSKNLRHVASSPAIFRNSSPFKIALPASSSLSSLTMAKGKSGRARLDPSNTNLGYSDTDTPPITPPARSNSPAWLLRTKTMSPRTTVNGTAFSLHGRSNSTKSASGHRSYPSSGSEAEGHLSVPPTGPPTMPWTRDTPEIDSEGIVCAPTLVASFGPDDVPALGLRSRNSSYTNLNGLARLRGGHIRQGSTYTDVGL